MPLKPPKGKSANSSIARALAADRRARAENGTEAIALRLALSDLYTAVLSLEPDDPTGGIDETDYRDAIRDAAKALGETVPKWVLDAWALDDTDPRMCNHEFDEDICIGCGFRRQS